MRLSEFARLHKPKTRCTVCLLPAEKLKEVTRGITELGISRRVTSNWLAAEGYSVGKSALIDHFNGHPNRLPKVTNEKRKAPAA